MAEPKTNAHDGDVEAFLASVANETRREGDWMLTGCSPRKQSLTVSIMPGFDRYDELMARLGKHKTGKSCLYVNKLEDVHLPTLKTLIKQSVAHMKRTQGRRD
jgi:hypothetical protein